MEEENWICRAELENSVKDRGTKEMRDDTGTFQ